MLLDICQEVIINKRAVRGKEAQERRESFVDRVRSGGDRDRR